MKRRTKLSFATVLVTIAIAGVWWFDPFAAKPILTLKGHTGRMIFCVAFSPDGKSLASGGEDQTIKLWDVATGRCRATLNGHTSWVKSVAFAPDGNTIASSGEFPVDQTVRLWDVATGKLQATLNGLIGPVAFSPDGRSLASHVAKEETICILNPDDGTTRLLIKDVNAVEGLAFSPDGATLVALSYSGMTMWNPVTGEERTTNRGPHGAWSLALASNGKTAAVSTQRWSVELWDISTGQQTGVLQPHSYPAVTCVAFSPNGKVLASADGGKLWWKAPAGAKLWDVASAKQLVTLRVHKERITALAFSPDGRILATASTDGIVKLWDVASYVFRANSDSQSDE